MHNSAIVLHDFHDLIRYHQVYCKKTSKNIKYDSIRNSATKMEVVITNTISNWAIVATLKCILERTFFNTTATFLAQSIANRLKFASMGREIENLVCGSQDVE